MDVFVTLAVIASIYCLLFFFDIFFKTCSHYPYIQFLKGTGLELRFLQLRWSTNAFNRAILQWRHFKPHYLEMWFNVGAAVTLLLLPVALTLLITSLVGKYISQSSTPDSISDQIVIEPIVPGITLPASELGYYSAALVLCSIVHEIGHALAALQEDVNVVKAGVNLYFILPVAYVNLNADKLSALHQWRFLKILCAGIWHNIILATMAYILYVITPYLYAFLFLTQNGVIVTSISPNSPLLGTRGLNKLDEIYKINYCSVTNMETYYDCLVQVTKVRYGYCVSSDFIHAFDESVPMKHVENGFDCCEPQRSGHLCYEYLDDNGGVMEIPPYVCLPARKIVATSTHSCGINNINSCPVSLHCIRPYLNNHTKLIKIERRASTQPDDIIYVGHPSDIYRTVEVSNFIPKYSFSRIFFPEIVVKFLEYVVIFSLGLAFVNVLPCLFMDGQYIIKAIFMLLFVKTRSPQQLHFLAMSISLITTAALIWHCLYSLYIKLK